MAEVFKWRLERDVSPSMEYNVITAQFGDGYEQTSVSGINNLIESWDVKSPVQIADARQMKEFFNKLRGANSFLWTPPLGELGLYKCKNPTFTPLSTTLFLFQGKFEKSYSSMSGG